MVDNKKDANIIFHGERDNAPLDITRLVRDTNYLPEFDLNNSFVDYVQWVEKFSL